MIDVETIRREEFPITRRGIYLDNATLGPPPARHVRAVTALLQRMSAEGLDDLFAISDEGVDVVRAKAAALLHADPSHVFFVRSTSHGVAVVAERLTWREGDEVVLYELDHPAGVFPWLNLADRGVKVIFIKDRGRFGFDADDVREMLSPRTRAVCVSLVNFAHGTRADVQEIAEMCRTRGIWFVVDAVQALGALTVDASRLGADVVVAHGYKFLLSGFGLGIACCSDRALAELKVCRIGWNSVENPFNVDRILAFDMRFPPSAKRFEPSFQPLPQVFGLGATLDLFHEVGTGAIEKHVLSLAGADHLDRGAQRRRAGANPARLAGKQDDVRGARVARAPVAALLQHRGRDRSPAELSLMAEIEEELGRRLEELGLRTSPEELRELASAYPALVAWMRMTEELAREEEEELPE